jgi:hypothetical protein
MTSSQNRYYSSVVMAFSSITGIYPVVLNIMVRWVAFVLHIQQVSDSDFSLETGHPDRFLVVMLSTRGICQYITLN